MKKKSFLLPLSALLSAIYQDAEASLCQEKYSIQIAHQQSQPFNFDFILARPGQLQYLARHGSHSSHSSHSSHASHSSHFSSQSYSSPPQSSGGVIPDDTNSTATYPQAPFDAKASGEFRGIPIYDLNKK